MNAYEPPGSPVGIAAGAEAGPEAPGSIVNVCKMQIRWILALGIVCALCAVCAAWAGLEFKTRQDLMNQLPDHADAAGGRIGTFGWLLAGAGLLAAVTSATLFRYFTALVRFRRDRRVIVLHIAMCRLRTVWCAIGVSMCVLGFAVLAAVVLRQSPGA